MSLSFAGGSFQVALYLSVKIAAVITGWGNTSIETKFSFKKTVNIIKYPEKALQNLLRGMMGIALKVNKPLAFVTEAINLWPYKVVN